MTIERKNVLTMSSDHYCKTQAASIPTNRYCEYRNRAKPRKNVEVRPCYNMVNINIAYYYAVGVHVDMVNPQDLLQEFTQYVPNEAEVVTDFIIGGFGGGQGAYSRGYASGTALIPKGVTASTATLVE